MRVCLSFSFCIYMWRNYQCVKRCSVLYLNSSIGTFTPSPYLDAHGEVALSMRYFCFITFF